ncbi:MAG: LacI family DNA-binding transcriptional regulator, partial [Actinophytocola sp.]|nr:LacI family DNA-binding transcriptional regulator [Actinophytocola sp.]
MRVATIHEVASTAGVSASTV